MADYSSNDNSIITIKDFLSGCAGNYPIEEDTFKYLAVKCNLILDSDINTLSNTERNVAELAMLRYLLRAPGMTQSVQDANGSWSHREGAVEMNSQDKKYLALRLKELEDILHVGNSSIKMQASGIRIWQQER